ncbi:MAG TPA: DUF6662 family protein [Chthoniobacterales bacterium]|nr:DUF6662 family protein [Chthoniobacterales bacterium]
MIHNNFIRRIGLLIILLWVWPAAGTVAGVRHFTFLYEAPTSAPGSVELENTVSWAHGSSESRNDVFFREEFEIGITDHFQVGLYPFDWSHHTEKGLSYDGAAIELIYNLSNPVIDPVGISLYEEISAARRHFELETKLIAQKNLGRWIFDYNATLEADWEEQHLEEQEGELQQALGASYEISPRLSVGLEFLHEFVFPEWGDDQKVRNVFVGPNVSYRRNQWFVTVTALAQATDTEDEPNFQLRTIFGIGF